MCRHDKLKIGLVARLHLPNGQPQIILFPTTDHWTHASHPYYIDQVVSVISPLISAAHLRIKTEVLDIEHFLVLPDMPFWRETNGQQQQYERNVHLVKMLLRFTIVDGATREQDAHNWTHVFENGRSEQDQACGSAVSYSSKDSFKRLFMIADYSDDPDFKNSGGGQRIDPKTLDGELVEIISIETNKRKRSDRSPGWFATDETGQISIALWETSFKAIDTMMRWDSGTVDAAGGAVRGAATAPIAER